MLGQIVESPESATSSRKTRIQLHGSRYASFCHACFEHLPAYKVAGPPSNSKSISPPCRNRFKKMRPRLRFRGVGSPTTAGPASPGGRVPFRSLRRLFLRSTTAANGVKGPRPRAPTPPLGRLRRTRTLEKRGVPPTWDGSVVPGMNRMDLRRHSPAGATSAAG